MAKVQRVSLFSRQIIEHLSVAGLEALLLNASRLSEGQVTGGRYYGSTMVTVDLRQLGGSVREACDGTTASRLARYISDDVPARERLGQLAQHEAREVLGRAPRRLETDIRVRAEGQWLFIDIDCEGDIAVAEEPAAARAAGGS